MKHEVSAPEITPQGLVRAVESQDELYVLDVRAPFRLANGLIDIVPPQQFLNIKGSDLLALEDPTSAGLPRHAPLAVVCGHGGDSRVIAAHLNAMGFRAASLRGGMNAWMSVTIPRELEPPPVLDRFVQFDRVGKGALGYLLISDGEALIVDPPRLASEFLELIRHENAKVIGVADTHAHADYISGGPALARALNVPYYLHPKDAVSPYDGCQGAIDFETVEEEEEIPVGRLQLRVVHTPGHTEGSVSYLIPGYAALTGDFLFVASVGRPDLGGKTEEWTEVLWESLERIRREWPPEIAIYPAHYATNSERNEDQSVGATLGELCSSNGPLGMKDRAQFARWVRSKAGSFPDAYRRIKGINLGFERPDEAQMDELEAGRNQCALG
jgi:glyoxylase-like metal-dependent hydrolase (beta-lactamase superfamily II)